MKILVIESLQEPKVKEIDNNLKSMQAVVGGLIQAICPFEDSTVALICNEEGKLIGLPLNRALRYENGEIYDIIAGTFFLCSAKPDEETFSSLTDEQIKYYTKQFKQIEIYIGR